MAQFLKDWETVKEIGSGGYGKVYEITRADSPDSKKYHSALKVINIPPSPEFYSNYEDNGYTHEEINSIILNQVHSIEKECQIMADLKGLTNIVSYEGHSIRKLDDGKSWQILIRMELLYPLGQYLNIKEITDQIVIALGKDICTALDRCLSRKIIHRDIKPQNLFINHYGDFKLGDFGIAKTMEHMTVGSKIGTYNYMAPEVFNNRPYDHRVDIYSLGLVLYWMLNERRMPFLPLPPAVPTVEDQEKARSSRLGGVPLPPPKNGSSALKKVVLKACAFRPEDRYATPMQFKMALEKAESLLTDAADTTDTPNTVHTDHTAVENTDTSSGTPTGNSGPVQESNDPEDNTCPWCFGVGGQVFVHRRKKHRYIAYHDRCRLCSGKGKLESSTIPLASKQMSELLHSQERWSANNKCKCCKGRGWVYSDQTAGKQISQANPALFGPITPCPRCAGHKVQFVVTNVQKKKYNKKLRRNLYCIGALFGILITLLPSLFFPEDAASADEFILCVGIFVYLIILYPFIFYFRNRRPRIVDRGSLKRAVLFFYLIAALFVSITSGIVRLTPLFPAQNPQSIQRPTSISLRSEDLEGEAREAFDRMVNEINDLMR